MHQTSETQVRPLGGLIPNPFASANAPASAKAGSALDVLQSLGGWLATTKAALFRHFEVVLVLVLLASLLFINFFIVHKFAFLLFYFIPILLAAFYLGTRQAMFAALLATGFVAYATLVHGNVGGAQGFGFWNLFIWSSFLTLTGAIVGRLQEKNGRQMVQLREAYLGIIAILTKYLESADAYTKSHSERVAAVSAVLAKQLGLSSDAVQNVSTAALLHDIGKIEVIELIRRPAELDPAEKAKVDNHTQLGAQLLLTAGTVLQDAIPIVLDHHRRYDDGEDAIPIGARILAVADAYDAIVSDRPYRAGRHDWQAVEILQEGAGRQFDPLVVDALENAREEVVTVYKKT